MPVLFGLPVVSILLFIFAGVLIGHLVWHHDRSGDENKIRELEDKYAKATGSADTRQQESLKLKQNLNVQGSDLEQVRLENQDLKKRYDAMEEAAEQAQAQLTQVQRDYQDAIAVKEEAEGLNNRNNQLAREAGDELARQSSLIDELQAANKHYADEVTALRKSLKDQGNAAQNVAESQKIVATLHEECEVLSKSKQQLQVALDAAHREIQAHDEQHVVMRKELAATAENGESAVKKCLQLEEQLKSVAGLKAERDEISEKYQAVSGSVVELQEKLRAVSEQVQQADLTNQSLSSELAERNQQLQQLEQHVNELTPLQAELKKTSDVLNQKQLEARQQLEIAKQQEEEIIQLRKVQEQVQLIQQEKDQAVAKLGSVSESNAKLQSTLSEQEKQIQTLLQSQEQHKVVVAEKESLAAKLNEVNSSTTVLRQTLSQKTQEIEALTKGQAAMQSLKQQFDKTAGTLSETTAENSQLKHVLGDKQIETETLRKQLGEVTSVKNELEQQFAGSAQAIAELKSQSELQTKAFAEQRSEVQHLKSQLAELERTKQSLHESSQKLSVVSAEREKLGKQHAGFQSQIQKLSTQVGVHANNVEDLQRQLNTKTKAHDQVVRQSREAMGKLQQQVAATETLRPQNKSLQGKVTDLTALLKQLRAELEDSLQANAKIEGRLRQLENQAHEDANTIRNLRRQRGSIDGIDGQERKAA